jgi:hypothetical protein
MTDDRYGKIHTDGSRSGGQPLDGSTEAKALALVNEARREYPNATDYTTPYIALHSAIEQHEAFRQKVSDAVQGTLLTLEDHCHTEAVVITSNNLLRFIIPKPKPDPLVQVLEGVQFDHYPPNDAKTIRAQLDAFGFEIREKGQ